MDRYIPPETHNGPFQLTKTNRTNILMNDYVSEGLMIGGTDIHVHKLLGIHEQNKLSILEGTPISNNEYIEFPISNIAEDDCSEWHSVKKCGLRDPNTFIGYDFGPIELLKGINKYSIPTEIKYHITSIFIQQGNKTINRVTKVRVENSNDGAVWKGISLLYLPDDGDEHWLDIKQSFHARYWRLVPISYNGTENDLWIIKKLSFSEYTKTKLSNTQDDIFLESRDRSYSIDPITIKAYYNLQEIQTDFSQWGIDIKNQHSIKFGFNLTIQKLKRPIIIGDILEIPCEIQYDTEMNPVKKYLEVTDVTWDSGGYTPGWQPTIYSITAQPMIASQETRDIVGDLNSDFFDSLPNFNTSAIKSSQKIRAEADTLVPEMGGSMNENTQISDEMIQKGKDKLGVDFTKLNVNPKDYLLEDAMPPNGLPYTEGEKFPDKPKNKDYHRITYPNLDEPVPARLYQYSTTKGRWLFMEEDKRMRSNYRKPQHEKFSDGVDISMVTK